MYNDIIKAIILGVIEGLTEFIPVSSTGHLILFSKWLNFQIGNTETFQIAIQLGAILAVVVLYRDFFRETFAPKNWFKKSFLNIFAAIIPVLALGFFTHSYIKTYLFSPLKVIFALLLGGGAMILIEKKATLKQHTTTLHDITLKQAFYIGLAQCFALWPGVSRSGATIIGGLLSGLHYSVAAQFSFIIAVPVMTAAVLYDFLKSFYLLTLYDLILIGVGLVVSFLVAHVALVSFLKLIERFKLFPFALYRIAIALGILLLL